MSTDEAGRAGDEAEGRRPPALRSFRSCRMALGPTGIGGYARALNPYLGCEFGCTYCYATYMARRHRGGEPWGRFVEAKRNVADALAAELARGPPEGRVLVSSVCDAYQPWERELGLTRACLQRLAAAGASVGVLTKSDLVTRDLDVLSAIPDVDLGFTVTTLDERLARRFEPGAPAPRRRLDAAARAVDAGIPVWVFVAPVLPAGGADDVVEVVEAAAAFGAHAVRIDSMNRKRYIAERLRRLLDAPAYREVMEFDFHRLKAELAHRLGRRGVQVEFIY